MTTAFLRREKARQCPVHTAVLAEAIDRLTKFGVFSKIEVLDVLNFEAIEDAIRWDYIRDFVQEEQGAQLVPLAEAYFKRHKKAEEHADPAKFIAQGHGKKTYGYASVRPDTDHLVIRRIEQRRANANGVEKCFRQYVKAVNDKRVQQGLTSLVPEAMQIESSKEGAPND